MKRFLNKKIAKIEHSKNTVCEISKSACRKLKFYKWLRQLISKKSAHEKMLKKRKKRMKKSMLIRKKNNDN